MRELDELDYAALTVDAEGRSEPIEGQIGILSVIRNRLRDGRWGSSYKAVALAPKQFSCWNDGTDANHLRLIRLAQRVQREEPVPELKTAYWLANGCLSGAMPDRVFGAKWYHVSRMAPKPEWAQGIVPACVVGNHSFYYYVK